jgi:hypothetical protein
MGWKIEDGVGRGYEASVSDVNRLNVSSKSQNRIFYISRDSGEAFNLVSTDSGATAGEYILYLQNTSTTKNMYVDRIEYHSANAALWKLWTVTGTAAGSSALTPTNLNRTSSKVAEATARGDGAITGLTAGAQLATHRNAADGEGQMEFQGALILGPNDAIAVEYDTGTTGAAEVDIFFWYESASRDT